MPDPAPHANGYFRSLSSTLVGRADELVALADAFDSALRGEARAVEIVGEAGIGKTALLDALTDATSRAGAVVLRGRTAEFERDVPFGPVVEALHGYPHGLDSAEPVQRHAALEAVRTLLSAQSRERPVVFVIDDLHWADRATVELVEAFMHRPPRGRVLVVVAYRPRQRDSAVSAGIARGVATGEIQRVTVQPLSVDDAASILSGRRGRDEVTRLHSACGGNPFYLHQVARTSASQGPYGPQGAPEITAGNALLESELAPLSPAARSLLNAAAVVGDPFDLDLAAEVAGDEIAGRVEDALDELVAADLVRERGVPRSFAFRHPLVRSGVYHAIGAGTRLRAHARTAEALAARGASDLERAHHVDQSAAFDDAEAIALLTRAGQQIAGRAPASAAHWLGAAWRRVPVDQRPQPEHTALLYALGLALTVSGQSEEALEMTRDAVVAFPPDHPLRPWFELGHASIEANIGQVAQARARLLELDSQVPARASLERLALVQALAMLDGATGRNHTASEFAERALQVARELGASTGIAAATATASWIDVLVGEVDRAEQRRAATAAQFAALTDGELAAFPVAVAALVRTSWLLDRPRESADLAARGLVITRGSSWPILVVQFLAAQAMAELAAGRIRAAGDVADSAIEAASLLDNDATRYWSLLVRSLALEPTGALQQAQDAAQRAVEESKQGLGSSALAGLAWARALLAAELPGRALDVIAQTHGGAHLPLQFAARRAESHAVIASAYLHRGELGPAREAADRARAAANQTRLPASAGYADAAAAECALAEGDPAAAVQLAASASEHARQAGADLAAARFDLLRGQALVACGDRDAAAVVLRACEATFATGGADRLQAEATRVLRQAGRRVTRSGRPDGAGGSPPEPLTARQREIAELAAAGRTNREIAEALFLSLKTIETHLSSVYVKLGVNSRKQLAEHWASHGESLADSA